MKQMGSSKARANEVKQATAAAETPGEEPHTSCCLSISCVLSSGQKHQNMVCCALRMGGSKASADEGKQAVAGTVNVGEEPLHRSCTCWLHLSYAANSDAGGQQQG